MSVDMYASCDQPNFTYLPELTCPEPFVGPNCDVTWADHFGASFLILQIYTGVFGAIALFIHGRRLINIFYLRAKFPKAFEALLPHCILMTWCAFASCIVSIDPWGYHNWIPRSWNVFFADTRIFCGYACATIVIFQWVAIVGAKGAQAQASTVATVIEVVLIIMLFVADVIIPPVAYGIVPQGVLNGALDINASAFQYAVNAFVGILTAIGSIVYALRIWSIMGGKTAIDKYKTQSKSGTATGADYDRMLKMRKIINNMIAMNTILWIAGVYSSYLCFSRISPGSCYIYYLPGDSFGFNITNTLTLIGPFVVAFVLAMPGQKSNAAKAADAVSTALKSVGGTVRGSTKVGNSKRVMVSGASGAESGAGTSSHHGASSAHGASSYYAGDDGASTVDAHGDDA